MDKQLKEALMKVINERAEQLGRKVDRTEIEPLLTGLGDRLSPLLKVSQKLESCGSFGCPNSYHCDWF